VIISQTTECLSRIADEVARGGVIAFRTDTFYGLGADPFNRQAVQKIQKLKAREEQKPILVVISDSEQVGRFIAERSAAFALLAERFWPGPLTMIGRAAPEVPEEITAGTRTVGVRLPDNDKVRGLVRACGGALTATSANPATARPSKTAPEVESYFGGAIDLIIDGGDAQTDRPSTVVDARNIPPRLVREGVIAWAEIQNAIIEAGTF
jgi:L-threonylcarbamoyladenylate synthase